MANIKLIRIDFRLIHGQVVNKWIKITRSNKIVVIDDSLASNEFMRSVYIMAAPLAQPDMVDFYRTYRPGALIFLLGLFIIQFVFGVAAVYRGK